MSIHRLPRLLSTLLAALFCLTSAAQDQCPPPLAPASPASMAELARHAQDRGFMWTIEKDGRSSHLYGTMHAQKLEWAPPGPRTMAALRRASTLALELDVSDPETVAQLAAPPAGAAPTPLPEDLRTRLLARMRAECVDPASVKGLAPEMQMLTLTVASARRDGLEAAYGADLVLAATAAALKKPVHSLETLAEQLAALTPADDAERIALVNEGLNQLEAGQTQRVMSRLATAWAASDADTLARYDAWCECTESDADRALTKRLLDDRNPRLADCIDALHRRQAPVFVGVGALHMFGSNNLPDLLRARGYTVTRVF